MTEESPPPSLTPSKLTQTSWCDSDPSSPLPSQMFGDLSKDHLQTGTCNTAERKKQRYLSLIYFKNCLLGTKTVFSSP